VSDATLRLAYAGFQPDRLAALLDRHGSARAVLRKVLGGKIKAGPDAVAAARVEAVQRRRELRALGIDFVARGSRGYPAHLAGMPDAPPGMFVRGELPASPGVAVVGTRSCTKYGLDIAAGYGRAIAAAGWVLVSGLARGIDGAAHRGTVAARGRGVAVLGGGLDVLYPREHGSLAADLLESGGAVVSEYPPGAAPLARRFPPRNRIISGLSRAVVVVEAGVKGGALITARLALEQGVTVFAVPGDVARDSSRGCNLLIRDGAHPVLDAADLVEELALLLGPPATAEGVDHAAEPDEVKAAVGSGAVPIDELAARIGLSMPAALATVGRLEAEGKVTFDGAVVRAIGH
jgi:DNA processing protein